MNIKLLKNHLEKLDKQYIWHPFTQMKDWEGETPVIITGGRGSFLKDMSGKWYLDGTSSVWVTVHGHGKSEINTAVKDQVDRISHSTLLGLTHPQAVKLAESLVQITPAGLSKVFYSDSGSTAVEIGLKMAFQYWQHKGHRRKTQFICLNNAYHGDTIGAVSVGGIDLSPYCYRCELGKTYPDCKLYCLKKTEALIKKHNRKVAGFILEPLVQGAGGMIVSPPGYLKGIRKLCRQYNILLIADEVATGFGRTGKMFACEHENVRPDILCLAKGITGGYLPLAATLTTEKIYNAFLGKFKDLKTFFHGHTYTGNQLACAAAIANLALFRKEKTLNRMQKKIELLKKGLTKISFHSHVGEVRQKGLMAGIELVRDKRSKEPFSIEEKMGWKVCLMARENGLLIRPLGNVVVLMPPLNISQQELGKIIKITGDSIKDVTET
jgi:adenosylmethionine-8-amino-7-oxononanoate aminotransferase